MRFIFLVFILLIYRDIRSQILPNPGFEEISDFSLPRFWDVSLAKHASVSLDSVIVHSGKTALALRSEEPFMSSQKSISEVSYTINANKNLIFDSIEVSVWLQTFAENDSSAGLTININNGSTILTEFVRLGDYEHGWQRLCVKFLNSTKISPVQVSIACFLIGTGSIHVDDFEVSINGKKLKDNSYTPDDIHGTINDYHLPILNANNQIYIQNRSSLKKYLNGVKILGSGESTHGNKEVQKVRFFLFKYLVDSHKFNTLAIENGFAETFYINEYIHSRISLSKDDLQRYLYKFWCTTEFFEIISWMKWYNSNYRSKLNIVGLDMQQYQIGMESLIIYAREKDFSLAKRLTQIDSSIKVLISESFDDKMLREHIVYEIIATLKYFRKNKSKFTGRKDEPDVYRMLHTLVTINQFLKEDSYRWNGSSFRSEGMFINLTWYLKHHPQSKMMLIAHNGHISNLGGPRNSFQNLGSLGSFLKKRYSTQYYSLGFMSANGTYLAQDSEFNNLWRPYALDSAFVGSLEFVLSKCNSSNFFLHLNNLVKKHCEWINKDLPQRSIGYVMSPNQYYFQGPISNLYDGIIFFNNSNPTTLLSND